MCASHLVADNAMSTAASNSDTPIEMALAPLRERVERILTYIDGWLIVNTFRQDQGK